MDWESLRTKYDKIMEIVHKTIPKSATLQSFHIENEYKSYTKHVLQGKKNCSDYKQAVDLDKRSGGGKIIMTFAFMIYVRTYGQDLQLLQDSSLVSEDSTIRVEKEKVLIFPNT